MIQLRSGNLWVRHKKGSWRRLPWSFFLLIPAVCATILLGVILSLNRSEATLAWLVADVPGGREFFWESVFHHGEVGLENALHLQQPPVQSKLPTIDIYVGDGVINEIMKAKLNGDRELGREPGGDRPYFPAYYVDESGKVQEAQVGLRGWGFQHHSPRKPSLRVRIKKDQVASGQRFVELQRPERITGFTNYLPERLALEFGVMTALSDYVRVFINRKFKGVYLRSYRPGEALTLAQGRLPGPYFKGDALGSYRGEDLWSDHKAWRIFEKTDRGVEYLDKFLDHIRDSGSLESRVQTEEFVDSEAFARWQALMTVVGSAHTDDFHNQVLFLNPMTGLFEPVLWDVNGLGATLDWQANVDRVPNRLIAHLMQDPRWTHRRNQLIHELITTTCRPDVFKERVDKLLGELSPELKADSYIAREASTPVSGVSTFEDIPVTEVDRLGDSSWQFMEQRVPFLTRYLEDARFAVRSTGSKETEVVVFGNVAIAVQTPDGERTLYPGQTRGAGVVPESAVPPSEEWVPAPLTYTLPYSASELAFRNAVPGTAVEPTSFDGSAQPVELTCFQPERFPSPPTNTVVLGPGTVHFREDLLLTKEQSLEVRPGTTLLLHPGCSIICHGKATLAGTERQPITVGRAEEAAWGVLALMGPKTEGSKLSHVAIEGGSLTTYRGIDFKGMVNVYQCPDITLESSRFGKNEVSDDAVNLATCKFTVRDCVWEGARSDGFDSDMSEGTVSKTRFLRTGNDGLDLMTSKVKVEDCFFDGCGDKGASIGEGSRARISSSVFKGCVIGSQVKDDSRAAYLDCVFEDCGQALDAYRKKWLYLSGGHILIRNCTFSAEQGNIKLDRRSTAEILNGEMTGAVSRTVTELGPEWEGLVP